MFWRVYCLVIGVVLVSHAVSGAANELPGSQFVYENWKGVAYSNSNGFSHCAISTTYNSGVELHFAIDKNGKWRLGISDPKWKRRVGDTFPVRYQIDRYQPVAASAYVVAPQFALVELIDKPFLFRMFRYGKSLHVRAGQDVYDFDLKGTLQALARASDCVAANNKNSHGPPLLGSQDQPQPQRDQQAASGEPPANGMNESALTFATSPKAVLDGTQFLTHLFSESEFSDYHLFNPKDLNGPKAPEFLKSGIAAWSASNAVGALHIVTSKDANPNDVISGLIASDSRKCSGSFTSGNTATKGDTTVASQFSACTKAEKYTFFNDYFAFQKAPGVIYVITGMQVDTDSVDKSLSEKFVPDIAAELEKKSAANSVILAP